MSADKIRLGLGVITHRRPDGLVRLLKSFAKLKVPEGVECTVLIAENDDVPMAAAQVDTLRTLVPFDLQVTLEPERGIPFARNRVLDMAIAGKFDFLTFVDDDQIVEPDWLKKLYATIAERQLDLVGGPRPLTPEPGAALSKQNRIVLRYFEKRHAGARRVKAEWIGSGKEAKIPIYTHNWIIRMTTQARLGVRFDERYRYTGGSDTQFYKDISEAGGLTGWSADARSVEVWPPERLTFLYLYKRRRDQTTMNYVRTGRRPKLKKVLLLCNRLIVFGFSKLMRAPFNDFASFAEFLSTAGETAGVIRAWRGVQSTHYAVPEQAPAGPRS